MQVIEITLQRGSTTRSGVQAMIKQLQKQLHSRSAKDRAKAAEKLGQLGELAHPCVPDLIEALNDPKREVRVKATLALGFLEAVEAVNTIIQLLKEENDMVRSAAVGTLSLLRDAQVVQPLLQLLKDKNHEIRDRTLRALGRIGDPISVQPLIKALNDPVPFVRWGAAVGLGFLGSPEAIEPLISLALCDEDRNLRWRAVEALGDIGNRRAVQPLRRIIDDENEDPDVQIAATIALNKIKGIKTA